MEYVKVEGHKNLRRDPETNALISIDNSGYDEYMMAKNARIEESCKTQNMEEDLANLKSEISEIKSLLKELVPHG